MQRNFLISNLYYNDAKMPIDKFHIEKNIFVLRQMGACLIASITDRSWETERAAEESSKESHRRLRTYLAICAISSHNHPRVILSSTPCQANDLNALNELARKGHKLRKAQSSESKDEPLGIDKVMELVFPEQQAKELERIKKNYKKFLRITRLLYQEFLPVISDSDPLLTATEYCLRVVSLEKVDFTYLIDAMICLEALFNDGGKDISYKIRTRGSSLLGLGGFDRNEVENRLKILYNKRSRIVHGQVESRGKREEVWDILELHEDIETYTSTCLKYFLILSKNRIGKKGKMRYQVLADLDCSLIDKNLRTSMEQEIVKGMQQFNAAIIM